MNTTSRKKANPHTWFFAYLKTVEGYGTGFDETIKESIVMAYSGRKTGSLKELYEKHPEDYKRMREALKIQTAQLKEDLDIARKRLIAVLFSFFGNSGPVSMDYVKAAACRAAKVNTFNRIPINTLKSLYRIFGTKNTKEWTEQEREIVWSAMRKESKN